MRKPPPYRVKNLLLWFLRCQHEYSAKKLGRILKISPDEYIELEEGLAMPTYGQLAELAFLYRVDVCFLKVSCMQLDIMLIGNNINAIVDEMSADNGRSIKEKPDRPLVLPYLEPGEYEQQAIMPFTTIA
jgi:transcriptional regulator with XRE-family HTH domain